MSEFPTAADEAKFWSLVESAWGLVGSEPAELRKALLDNDNDEAAYALHEHQGAFLEGLRTLGREMSAAELTALDRVVERKLYDIDRADIHEITDGSDDGFLYCRGFIVAMGRDYYDAVVADSGMAVPDAECETMCYLFAHIHNERFGDFPDTGSGITRESFSNAEGWAEG
ncbi:DUF4240 domain-containing protein [Nocardia bhagyanarayanae]|uniref:Uncharacterized protein DUF4240 n=1 Tax=Nocardia bhagyanarayanae TaxID=1215925 RepID=A0A543FDU7_9NOCA|nr:DUF4240 domain-containing protein [Nocardia bhagyanarayanae]TQM32060.1 uncharacterized protein DUF4240 [Nocardia bhagyanarayanae]